MFLWSKWRAMYVEAEKYASEGAMVYRGSKRRPEMTDTKGGLFERDQARVVLCNTTIVPFRLRPKSKRQISARSTTMVFLGGKLLFFVVCKMIDRSQVKRT